MKLTYVLAQELFYYNSRSGVLRWKWRNRKWFSADDDWKRWNTRYADKPALNAIGKRGYRQGSLFGRTYQAHLVIWLLVTGRTPRRILDHKNRKSWDNRWTNLRESNKIKNSQNRSLSVNNRSGQVGVWEISNGVWKAGIGINNRTEHLGYHNTFEAACAARKAAEAKYGFDIGHGSRRAA